jgi:hypothetical protein
MKPFLKKFAQVGGIVALALVLGIGVSVFADNYVGAPVFPENAPTPLNVTSVMQTKLGTANFGNNVGVTNTANVLGGVNVGARAVDTGGSAFTSALNVFGKTFINNVDTTFGGLKIGGAANSKGLVTDSLRAALDIDLTGRTGAGSVDGISIKSALGAMTSAFITNSQVFHFYSDLIAKDARIWAGSIKLSEYSPSRGKILFSGNDAGDAVWGTLNQGNIDIKYVSSKDLDGGTPRVNKVYCPTGYQAIGGGGFCDRDGETMHETGPIVGTPNSGDWTWSNVPSSPTDTDTGAATNATSGPANGWMVRCSGGAVADQWIHVYATCMKITPPSVTIPTPTSVTAVGGAVGGRTWQYATLQNANASSCATAFGTTNAADLGVKIDADYVSSINAPSVTSFSFTKPISANPPTYGAKCMLLNDTTDKVTLVDAATPKPAGSSWVGVGTSSIIKVDDLDAGVNIWALGQKQSFLASLEKKVSDFLVPVAHAIPPGGNLPVEWTQQKGWAVIYR